eukprot:7021262-Ditylum_brightwellii.AAC.2
MQDIRSFFQPDLLTRMHPSLMTKSRQPKRRQHISGQPTQDIRQFLKCTPTRSKINLPATTLEYFSDQGRPKGVSGKPTTFTMQTSLQDFFSP